MRSIAVGFSLVLLAACSEGGPAVQPDSGPALSADAALVQPDAAILISHDAASATPEASVLVDASAAAFDATSTAGEAGVRDASAPSPSSEARVDAAAPRSCLGGGLKSGTSSFTLKIDGQERSVNLFVPRSHDGKQPLPLVVDFHGLHEGAALHALVSRWDDVVDSENFVVAMPQGIDNAWNLGPCCTSSRSIDDVKFARELVAYVLKEGCIDPQRIYATGYSNGGGMSLKLACDASDLFAATAPAAFDLLEEMNCKPSRPISVFLFRGTDDPIVGYAGGASTPPTLYALPEIHFLGAQKTVQKWAELNGCSGAAEDGPNVMGAQCKSYNQCKAGVKVTLCTKQGGGHDPSDPTPAWPMLKAFTLP